MDETDTPARPHWRFDKTVSVANVFSTIAAVAVLVGYGQKLDSRLLILEQQVAQQIQTDRRQDDDRSEIKRQVREDNREINRKLDRLIESRHQGK